MFDRSEILEIISCVLQREVKEDESCIGIMAGVWQEIQEIVEFELDYGYEFPENITFETWKDAIDAIEEWVKT
jgi:hypothetical protein